MDSLYSPFYQALIAGEDFGKIGWSAISKGVDRRMRLAEVEMKSQLISSMPETLEGEVKLHVPLRLRRGTLKADEIQSVTSAINNLKRIAITTGRDAWSDLQILDFGCGVKFTQALVQFDVAVGRYVGMDVNARLIEYLQNTVADPAFEYHVVPFRNQMYNPTGEVLSPESELPGGTDSYDLITLQSVFTHFDPDDFQSMLMVLRRYAADQARLFFTCFIRNDMASDFVDSDPQKPLLRAYYREEFVRDMLARASWNVVSLSEPTMNLQHHFVASPR